MKLEYCICGGKPIQRTYLRNYGQTEIRHYVECLRCGKQSNDYKTKYNAERGWNNWMIKTKTIKPNDSLYWTVTNTTGKTFKINNIMICNSSKGIDGIAKELNESLTISPKIEENKKETSKFSIWWNKYFGFLWETE